MIRKIIATGMGVLLSSQLLGCASTPSANAPAAESSTARGTTATESEAASAKEPKVVLTTEQAKKYASEEEVQRAYRECKRKMRRITGSRIARDACQGSPGVYGRGYNQPQENVESGAASLPSQ